MVSRKLGAQYVIPTLGVWNNSEGIDLDLLPDKFVLKRSHGSGSTIICKDKATFDYGRTNKKLSAALNHGYYLFGREWVYKNIPRKILADPYIEDEYGGLKDYKFFCFNGVVKYFAIHFDRYAERRANYFSRKRELPEFGEFFYPPNFSRGIKIPGAVEQTTSVAENIPFVRVDFYNVRRRIYFGETTF